MLRLILRSALLFSFASLSAPSAFAQAWVGEENHLSLSASYAFSPSSSVIFTNGRSIGNALSVSHTFTLGAEYTPPLPGLAVNVMFPLMAVKFDNLNGRAGHGRFDDGELHFTSQDLRLGARYMFIDDPLAASFGVAGSIPVTSYPVTGYTAPGRHLMALYLTAAVGIQMPFLPELFAHALYELSLVQSADVPDVPQVADFGQHRSQISAQVGYFIIPELQVNLSFDFRLSHDGINFVDIGTPAASFALGDLHELITKEQAILLGGGAQFNITESMYVSADARIFLSGQNTRDGHLFGLSFGVEVF